MTNLPPYPPPAGAPVLLPPLFQQATPRRIAWELLPVQVVLTGAVSWLVIVVSTDIDGSLTEPMQFLGLALLSTPATIAIFLLGIPLRVARPLRTWWFHHARWGLVAAVVCIASLVVAYYLPGAHPVHYPRTVDWPESDGYDPDYRVFLPAGGVLIFITMHMLPATRRWRQQNL